MNPSELEQDLPLHVKRFPLMVDKDTPAEWFPLLAGFPKFLRVTFPKSLVARELVLELFQRLDHYNGEKTTVRLSDETAERRTGIDRKSLKRCRQSPEFKRWVTVCPGEQRKAHYTPLATVYDLHRLMLRFNSWSASEREGQLEADQKVLDACIIAGAPGEKLLGGKTPPDWKPRHEFKGGRWVLKPGAAPSTIPEKSQDQAQPRPGANVVQQRTADSPCPCGRPHVTETEVKACRIGRQHAREAERQRLTDNGVPPRLWPDELKGLSA